MGSATVWRPGLTRGTPGYFDGAHLTGAYAAALGPVLRPQLLAAAGRR